jgi:hypothetical protein
MVVFEIIILVLIVGLCVGLAFACRKLYFIQSMLLEALDKHTQKQNVEKEMLRMAWEKKKVMFRELFGMIDTR